MLLFLARAMCSNSIFQPKRQNWGKNGALLCTPRWVFLPISDGWLSSLAAAHMLKNEGLNIKKKIHNHVIAQAVERDHSRANTQEDCKKEGTRALSFRRNDRIVMVFLFRPRNRPSLWLIYIPHLSVVVMETWVWDPIPLHRWLWTLGMKFIPWILQACFNLTQKSREGYREITHHYSNFFQCWNRSSRARFFGGNKV